MVGKSNTIKLRFDQVFMQDASYPMSVLFVKSNETIFTGSEGALNPTHHEYVISFANWLFTQWIWYSMKF